MESSYQYIPEDHAKEYRITYEKILHPDLLEKNIQLILAPKATYDATAYIGSFVIGQFVQVDMLDKGKRFLGISGGLSVVGLGISKGNVRTDNIERLYSDTTDFTLATAVFYIRVNFYDKDRVFLGHYDGGGVGVAGGGRGTGKWSPTSAGEGGA